MAESPPILDAGKQRSNRMVAAVCVVFFASMVGAAYAAVPFYAMFCQLTGYGGTTQRVTQYSDRVLDRQITVRFDANVSGGVPWDFQPAQRDVTMKIGETTQVAYTARNLFDRPSAGRATFNVTPELAGAYFNKVECFCFTDTTLKGGESITMPVVFYVDPAIDDVPELKNMKTITLSYTLFPVEPAPAKAVDATGKTGETADENIGG
ncbi:cytochrome c oxidase assembly protein [Mesorhizobium sp. LHD-90]|uniref:cytochrome c oxidase assembly protein n=1 Tax=Mesorhizobium sp. LHD-90 TaxID=3071414 RepID=UPI0027DEBD17|nr:cytochrome c oxidase assembly protein [Mesorhizobium sp. LHD-90]MDQ6435970.1 cytochrome c oxidase assembly protein [Mesorhizobium sp. LHD-90]